MTLGRLCQSHPQAMDAVKCQLACQQMAFSSKNVVKEEEESPAPPSEPPAEPTMPDAGLPGEGKM